MDKFLTPFPMLTGVGSGKAYLILGVLVALALAAKRDKTSATTSNS